MRPLVSLIMIVKNEESHLPACLESAADLVDEIVVVDTGSADRTVEIARRYGSKIYDFPWVNDFAAARNESLHHASHPWVFWMDADDRLDQENRGRFKSLVAGLKDERAAYVMTCICPTAEPTKAGNQALAHVRLFRHAPGVHWQYRIHEKILPSLEALQYEIHQTDIRLFHVGYQNPAILPGKRVRNLRLLHLKDAELPNDPATLYQLGQTYQADGQLTQAQHYYQRSLSLVQPDDHFQADLYAMLTQVAKQLGQTEEALRVCRMGRAHFPNEPELIFQEAWLHYLTGDFAGAEASLLQLVESDNAAADPSICRVGGYMARHNLAVLYRSQNRLAEAEAQWRSALAEQSKFSPARMGLADVCLCQQRWQELEQILTQLESEPNTVVEAGMFRAKKHLALRDYAAARQIIEQVIAGAPQILGPRVLLSRLLLEENRDLEAAERALRDVLSLDPDNAEARQNLQAVLSHSR